MLDYKQTEEAFYYIKDLLSKEEVLILKAAFIVIKYGQGPLTILKDLKSLKIDMQWFPGGIHNAKDGRSALIWNILQLTLEYMQGAATSYIYHDILQRVEEYRQNKTRNMEMRQLSRAEVEAMLTIKNKEIVT